MEIITLFFTVLAGVFVAEMGDKTQLMLIAMSSKYKVRHIVTGTAAAILLLNAIAVAAGGLLSHVLNSYGWIVSAVACLAFFYFSITSLNVDDDDEEGGESKLNFAPLAVFCTFFVAELGDKTQLASVAFGADNGLNFNAVFVWIAASIGLFAADMIGLIIGKFLNGKTPSWFFNLLSFVLFAAFGFLKLPETLNKINVWLDQYNREIPDIANAVAIAGVVFAALVALVLVKRFKSNQNAD